MSTTSDETPGRAAIPLSQPPREGPLEFFRRWLRSRGRHHGLRYLLSLQGFVVLGALVCLFVPNGIVNRWRIAYDVSVQITSPWDKNVTSPWLAFPLALAGWLAIPSIVGALVGYTVVETSNNRRTKPPNESSLAKSPGSGRYIPRLDSLLYEDHGHSIKENFVKNFVGLHKKELTTGRSRQEWVIAQSHWELIVADFLESDAVDKYASSNKAIHQAVSAAVSFLQQLDRCPECTQSQTGPKRSHP